MNVLLAITPEQYADKIIKTAGFFETLGFGGMMLGIGMLAVFAVLCTLWGALILFKIGFYDLPSKKKAEKAAGETADEKSIKCLVNTMTLNNESYKALLDLELSELKQYSELFEEDVYDAISMQTCVGMRYVVGGPAPEAVQSAIDEGKAWMDANVK